MPPPNHGLERPRPAGQVRGKERIEVEPDIRVQLVRQLDRDDAPERLHGRVQEPPEALALRRPFRLPGGHPKPAIMTS